MLFFGTIIYENKTPDKSCVIIRSFLRDPSKLPNYLLLRRGQPCQSTGSSLPPPSPPSLRPSSPSTPSNTAHSRLNGSQKFAQQRSDAAARTNKGSFTLDELIKRQVGDKTCCFFSRRKTIGPVVCKESVGETFLIDKRGTPSCFQGLGLKRFTWCNVEPRVSEPKERRGFDLH